MTEATPEGGSPQRYFPGFRTSGRRVLFLCFFLIAYVCLAAGVFKVLEDPWEQQEITRLRDVLDTFRRNTHSCIADEELENFIIEVVRGANRGVSAVRNVTMSESNWSFGQAMFFATTILTTIGYGRVTPLSDAGKGFCIVYAIIGIPLTLIMFTAIVERIMIPVTKLLDLLLRKLGHLYKVFHIRLLHLFLIFVIVLIFVFLIPAGIYAALEPTWNYLDSFYYCFISMTTIGLGDYIPGDNPYQPYRPLYKVATTGYLIFGLIMMMLLLAVIYEIPELNIGFHFYLKNENEDDERMRLRASDTSGPKYTQQVNEVSNAGYPGDQP
ncbi:potassium channel subfamily K member 1-like [Liolophura sinensis]|uniref:potassium channel subfamily K member 1-like n=1 Tax=Liolophura sinensis TaxID=3198878 RepID=UPI003158FA62